MTPGLAYGLAAAGANIVGALAVTVGPPRSVRALDAMRSIGAGFIVSIAFIELFPEAMQRNGAAGAEVALAAYLLVHLTQHTIGRHFHFGEEIHHVSHVAGLTALVGLLLHTFADGVAVASGALVSGALGMLVFLAVLLHKFPEGLAISSLFMAAGRGRTRALLAATALGVATVLGVLLTDQLAFLRDYGMAIAAGVTLYVGASNLVPQMQLIKGWRVPVSFLAGCGLFFAARALATG